MVVRIAKVHEIIQKINIVLLKEKVALKALQSVVGSFNLLVGQSFLAGLSAEGL